MRPTRRISSVGRRYGRLVRRAAKPSSSCCSRLARLRPTRRISSVERRYGGLVRRAAKPSLSCCLRLARSRSIQRVQGILRRFRELLRTGTRRSSRYYASILISVQAIYTIYKFLTFNVVGLEDSVFLEPLLEVFRWQADSG